MNEEELRDKIYTEAQCIVEDNYKAAEDRIKSIEESIPGIVADEVEKLLEEDRQWRTNGVGNSISREQNSITDDGANIFEQYDSINEPNSNGDDKKKYKNLSEAEFAASGFSIYSNPLNEQTIERLRLQQDASLYQWINFPIARSEIETLKRYILGRGVKVDCLAPEVLKQIHNFWRVNRMEKRNKKALQSYLLKGEYFPLLFDNFKNNKDFDPDIDSLLIMRSVPSEEIAKIEVDQDDREANLSYLRIKPILDSGTSSISTKEITYMDISYPYGDEKENELPLGLNSTISKNTGGAEENCRMTMWKYGLEDDERGRVIMESVLRWNRVAVDFLYSRARLNHLRSKIYLIEEHTGAGGKRTTTSSSKSMPQGGVVLVETPDKKYRLVSPNTGAVEAEHDYNLVLYMIGSALAMPIHILMVNAENENYASIKEAGNPFNQAVCDFQDDWQEYLQDLLRYLIKMGIRYGVLKKEYKIEYLPEDTIGEIKKFVFSELDRGSSTRDILEQAQKLVRYEKKEKVFKTIHIPISITFPNLLQSDPTKEAQAIKIFMELGLMSKYTARLRTGLDPDVEESRLEHEWEQEMEKKDQIYDRFNNGAPDYDKNAKPNQNKEEPEEEPEPGPEENPEKPTKESLDSKVNEFIDSIFEWEEFDGNNITPLSLSIGKAIIEASEDRTLKERQTRYREKNQHKVKARAAVHKALRDGSLKNPGVCSKCGKKAKVYAHHGDYRKPLEVAWLCRDCEIKADNKKQGKSDTK